MARLGAIVAEVVTGEAVVLDVPCARFPSRLLAIAIDLVIQVITLVVLVLIATLASGRGGLDPASGAAVTVALLVAVVVGYPVTWETLSAGRSPGKFALGLRVVSDDGGPERFRQALVRGLAGAVEIWSLAGCPALICSLLSGRGKRLGDVFAGTFVIQQRLPARRASAPPSVVAPWLAQWAATLDMSGLTDQTAQTARGYLARMGDLAPAARVQLGEAMAATIASQVSPPPPAGTPAPAFLEAVLAERRRREDARLAFPGPLPSGPLPAAGPAVPAGPAPSTGPARAEPGPGTPGMDGQGAPWEGDGSPDRAPRPGPAAGGFVPPA